MDSLDQGTAEPAKLETASETHDLAPARPPMPDLRFWLVVVGLGGLASLFLRQLELAALLVVAGLFAVAHAADVDPARRPIHYAVSWTVPAIAAFVFLTLLGAFLPELLEAIGEGRLSGPRAPSPTLWIGAGLSVACGLLALAGCTREVANVLARRLFRIPFPSHVDRLAVRLVWIGLLMAAPASLAFPIITEGREEPLVGTDSLWANLVGLTVLALAGVGYRVRRGARDTLDRLGLTPLRGSQALLVALGVAALIALNAGAEAIQRTWLPELWNSDQRINHLIAGQLTRTDVFLLGVSAGVGEELVLRGALQPRLGLFLTSLLFAVLHVQYSWFGMGIILALGLILGWIRRRASTTTAIAVHVLYDVLAVFSLRT